MQKVGLNMHAQNLADRNKALQWLKDNKPEAIVVLDDQVFASQAADLGIKYVILRITTNDDNIHLKLRSFQEWWNAVKAKYTDKRLIVHFGNEPHTNFELLSSMSCSGMITLANEGHRGIFGNFSVGTPEFKDWDTSLRPMLEYLTNEYKDYHFLGIHEYWMNTPELCIPYELGRYNALFDYYPRNSLSIILTEFGTDYIPNINMPKQTGIKDYDESFLLEKTKLIVNSIYSKPEIKGICYFCYGNSGGWDKYNLEGNDFLNHFGEFEMQDILPEIGKQYTVSSTGKSTNRRTEANTTSAVNGSVTTGTQATLLVINGDWYQFRFEDGIFWLNKTVINLVSSTSTQVTLKVYDAPTDEFTAFQTALNTVTSFLKKYNYEIS